MDLFWEDWSSFCQSLCFSSQEGEASSVVGIRPTWWCTSPRGVVPVGLGDGAGHCHDVANLPRVRLFMSLLYLFCGKNYALFFFEVWFCTVGHCWICW